MRCSHAGKVVKGEMITFGVPMEVCKWSWHHVTNISLITLYIFSVMASYYNLGILCNCFVYEITDYPLSV